MTAEGSTGAPLRQQIAEAIHAEDRHSGHIDLCDFWPDGCIHGKGDVLFALSAADAVVALLNLTEADLAGTIMWYFGSTCEGDDPAYPAAWAAAHSFLSGEDETPVPGSPGPWRLPSTPPDTSSPEPA
jgi:hypothetical protein